MRSLHVETRSAVNSWTTSSSQSIIRALESLIEGGTSSGDEGSLISILEKIDSIDKRLDSFQDSLLSINDKIRRLEELLSEGPSPGIGSPSVSFWRDLHDRQERDYWEELADRIDCIHIYTEVLHEELIADSFLDSAGIGDDEEDRDDNGAFDEEQREILLDILDSIDCLASRLWVTDNKPEWIRYTLQDLIDPERSIVLKAIESISGKLDYESALDVELAGCDNEESNIRSFAGVCLASVRAGTIGLLQKLDVVQSSICDILRREVSNPEVTTKPETLPDFSEVLEAVKSLSEKLDNEAAIFRKC